mgnify:CR=1 FL=1
MQATIAISIIIAVWVIPYLFSIVAAGGALGLSYYAFLGPGGVVAGALYFLFAGRGKKK